MLKPVFSYLYGGKDFNEVDSLINTKVISKEYPEFDAVEWHVTFENSSNINSDILSNIKDCDILLELPDYHRGSPTLRITEEAPKIMWMQGILEGMMSS